MYSDAFQRMRKWMTDVHNLAGPKAHNVKDSPAALIRSLREGESPQQLKNNPPLIEIRPKPFVEMWLGEPVVS